MKDVRVVLKQWIDGSGWSYSSTIDVSKEETNADEYASEYFAECEIEENADYKIVIVDNETNEEISESDWASSFKVENC